MSMQTVRNINGEVIGQVDEPLRFRAGDIVRKRKHRRTEYLYLITHIGENNGHPAYHYFHYKNELFENHQGSGWKKADYFDRRVETAGEEKEWIDMDMGSFDEMGHVKEETPYININGELYYTLSFDRLSDLFTQGFSSIKPAQLFYETAGTKRAVAVHQTGEGQRGLADDMLRLSYLNEDGKFVEHKKNVMKALTTGLWIPIKDTEAKVKGVKETRI